MTGCSNSPVELSVLPSVSLVRSLSRVKVIQSLLQFVTKQGVVCSQHRKPNSDRGCLQQSRVPSKENGQIMCKRSELPDGFQARVFKDIVRGEGPGYVINLWTSFWLAGGKKGDDSGTSTFRFQPVSGWHACGQHVVTIPQRVGVSASAEQLRDMQQTVIHIPSGGARSPGTLLS